MGEHPTVHLWSPIVGSELCGAVGNGVIDVHVPVSLAARIATECGESNAAMFLELLVRAALRHLGTVSECPDLHDDIASVVEQFGWHGADTLEVTMVADFNPLSSSVRVTTAEPLTPIELPMFPSIQNVAGWSSKNENLWEPYRFISDVPMVVSARAGGRPGWGIARGVDLHGAIRGLDGFEERTFRGWPQIVLRSPTELVRLAAEWDMRNRAGGEVLAVNLRRIVADNQSNREGPEWTIGIESAPPTVLPVARVMPGCNVEGDGNLDEDELFDTPRVMVTASKHMLHQLGEETWEVRFDYSPDGLWCLRDDCGATLWVPSRADGNPEAALEHLVTLGEHGYFVHLYRFDNRYLFRYSHGWENRTAGWLILDTTDESEARAHAQRWATELLDSAPELDEADDDEDGDGKA